VEEETGGATFDVPAGEHTVELVKELPTVR
jgi:hypothetical protein